MSSGNAPAEDLTTSQVAALLRVSQATVSRIPKDRLDYRLTPGGHRRYHREDVDRAVREGWITETSPALAGGPSLEQRVAELEAQVRDLRGDRSLLGQLQAELIELYARLGQPYPGAEQRPTRARKRGTG